MSQNEGDFQSKPRSGGQKFGGKGRGDRDFSKKPSRDRGDRPARSFDRDSRPPRDRDASDRPYKKREFGSSAPRGEYKPEGRRDFSKRPERSGGDRPARSFDRDSRPPRDRDAGDRPYKKREFGSSAPRGEYKPEGRRDFGKKPERNGGDRPARSFDRDSRPPRDRDAGDRPYKKREFNSSEPKREYRPEGRRDFGDKKSFNKEKRFDRPQKSYARYEDRPARRDFSEERAPANTEARSKLKSDRPGYGAPSSAYLYGIHAVTQAILNPKRKHNRLLCTPKAYEAIQEAWSEAEANGLALPEVISVEKEDIERLLPREAVHQDILLDCQPLEETSLYEFLLTAADDAKILVLDQVTDPHNVGAILRSAAAFGATAVVMQTLHAPEVTGTLAKSASGALEHVPLIREVNLSRALEQLKKANFFCIGLDEDGKSTLAKLNLTGKTALVLGAEGAGLRRLVAENCDELVHLPTQGAIGSLNVSNAAAVALYELVRK